LQRAINAAGNQPTSINIYISPIEILMPRGAENPKCITAEEIHH